MKKTNILSLSFITLGSVLVSIFLTFGSHFSSAEEAVSTAPTLDSRTVRDISKPKSVKIPNNYGDGSLKDFKYITLSVQKFDPSQFTIVYLPGRPGGSSSGDLASDHASKLYPKNTQRLLIDPRGTGMNLSWGAKHPELLSSKDTANDVVEVLRKEQLTNYILWGSSYGTVVGTMLAAKIQELEIPHPKAVVLEGTLGKYLEYTEYFFEGFDLRIKNFYENAPRDILSLISDYKKIAKSEEDFKEALQSWVFAYEYNQDKKDILSSINATINMRLGEIQAKTYGIPLPSQHTHQIKESPEEKGSKYNTWIICKELVNNSKNVKIKIDKKAELCTAMTNSPDLYDSKNYQITDFPIIYLQGFQDLQTPYPSAVYHLSNQQNKQSNSKFFLIFGQAHAVFFRSKFLKCKKNFVESIKNSDFEFGSFLNCAKQLKTKIKQL